MKQAHLALASLGAAILIIGVGCEQLSETSTGDDSGLKTKDANETMVKPSVPEPAVPPPAVEPEPPKTGDTMEKKTDTPPVSKIDGTLVLTAQAQTDRSVTLTWSAPEGLTEANRFILVQGPDAYPVHDGKHHWFRQFYTSRELNWKDLLPGTIHFRICMTEDHNNDVCTKYSNDTEAYIE